MSRLIETIRLNEGKFNNLPYHAARMQRAWAEIFEIPPPFVLDELLADYPIPTQGLYKFRITYDTELRDLEIIHYSIKPVTSLKLVYDDTIAYNHKFKDRTPIDALFARRGTCDDVLIIRKGLVTDTSYANILFKKNNEWFTPASCLLPGTMRQSLMERKLIKTWEGKVGEISTFESFKLINSMLMGDAEETGIENIICDRA